MGGQTFPTVQALEMSQGASLDFPDPDLHGDFPSRVLFGLHHLISSGRFQDQSYSAPKQTGSSLLPCDQCVPPRTHELLGHKRAFTQSSEFRQAWHVPSKGRPLKITSLGLLVPHQVTHRTTVGPSSPTPTGNFSPKESKQGLEQIGVHQCP